MAAVTEQLRVMTERQAALEDELRRARAAPPPPPQAPAAGAAPAAGVGIDTRLLGRPSDFDGREDSWRNWSVVFEGYASAAVQGLGAAMAAALERGAMVVNATLDAGQVRMSEQLYWMLLMLAKGPALQLVLGAGRGEGLEAWRILNDRCEPRLRTRYAAHLMQIMSFNLNGDLLEWMALWEREIQTSPPAANRWMTNSGSELSCCACLRDP